MGSDMLQVPKPDITVREWRRTTLYFVEHAAVHGEPKTLVFNCLRIIERRFSSKKLRHQCNFVFNPSTEHPWSMYLKVNHEWLERPLCTTLLIELSRVAITELLAHSAPTSPAPA